jgi:hypothetical protein
LAAGLGEGQVAAFVEDDEVEAAEVIGGAPLTAGSCLGVELVDQIDSIEEAATRTAPGSPRDQDRMGTPVRAPASR